MRLQETLARPHRDGTVTIMTRNGEPYAATVPLSRIVREAPRLTTLRGSARGCYGNAAWYIDRLRDEWKGGT